jgi:hypothetical protein
VGGCERWIKEIHHPVHLDDTFVPLGRVRWSGSCKQRSGSGRDDIKSEDRVISWMISSGWPFPCFLFPHDEMMRSHLLRKVKHPQRRNTRT